MNTESTKQVDIVFFSMSRWAEWDRGTVNRSYHVVHQLRRDPRVRTLLVVDALPVSRSHFFRSFFHRSRPSEGNVRIAGPRWSVAKRGHHVYSLTSSLTLHDHEAVWQAISQATEDLGMQEPVYWSTVPFLAPYMQKTSKEHVWIFDIVDNWMFHGSYQRQKEELRNHYQSISRHADAIFTVSRALLKLFPNRERVYWVPNGVDPAHFAQEGTEPIALRTIARPYAVYTGTIESRFDASLLGYIADAFPDVSFVLLGDVWPLRFRYFRKRSPVRQVAKSRKNIRLLGRIPYAELPKYLTRAALGIIPHTTTAFTESMDPLKIYEYLASGLPVVSTPLPDQERFPPFVHFASTQEDFRGGVAAALERTADRAQIQLSINDQGWDRRVATMLDTLEKTGSI